MRLLCRTLAVALLLLLLSGLAYGEEGSPVQGEPQPQFAIAGIYVQPSADLLRRFSIISGDPGGDMRYEDTITRAEMVKVVVAALGLSDSARAAGLLPPAFTDVKDHWSAGWVTVARLRNLTGGYPDGTFRPDSPVTYAEAVTLLLRSAEIRPDGRWPDSYMEAAREHGILDDRLAAAMKPGEPARRGGVFLLAERVFTRIRDEQGTTVLQRSFQIAPPALEATARVEGTEVLVTGRVEGAEVVHVDGRPAIVTDGMFSVKVPLRTGALEVLVHATGDTGAQTVRQVPFQ